MSREQSIKKLGLTLKTFRRLCILKGVFPAGDVKGGRGKIYYHAKDIRFLLHEPLLKSFDDIRGYNKAVKKALDEAAKEKETGKEEA